MQSTPDQSTPIQSTPIQEAQEQESKPLPGRSLRRTRWVLLWVLLFLGVVFHARLLGTLAWFLQWPEGSAVADVFVILGQSGPYRSIPLQEMLLALQEEKCQEVLLIEDRSSRVVKRNVLPTLENVLRKEFTKRELKPELLQLRVHEGKRAWDGFRELKAYLSENPDKKILLAIHPLQGRRLHTILSRVLSSDERIRVNFTATREVRYDLKTWWHSRLGILALFGGYVDYLHLCIFDEPPQGETFDPQEYSKELQKQKEIQEIQEIQVIQEIQETP